jgi:hypothetical protein
MLMSELIAFRAVLIGGEVSEHRIILALSKCKVLLSAICIKYRFFARLWCSIVMRSAFRGAVILSPNRSVYFTALILKRFFDSLNLARFLLHTVTWQPFYGDGPDAVALFWSKYMRLKSDEMAMSSSEKSWLNWFGSAGKLKMGWACWLNKSRYPVVEKAFESIANTRMNILQQWTNSLWDSLETLSSQLRQNSRLDEKTLMTQLGRSLYVSEYFVIDSEGYVLETTFERTVSAWPLY